MTNKKIAAFSEFESHCKHNMVVEGRDDNKTVTSIPELKPEDIVSVYVGKPNSCMCGCSGTYYYSKAHQAYGGKNRGYAVSDDEVGDAKVMRVYNKMKSNAGSGVEVIDDYIYTIVIGNKQYTIYLKEKAVK